MERQVQKPDYDWHPSKLSENGDEILFLKAAQQAQGFRLLGLGSSQYERSDGCQPLRGIEHAFGAAEADTFGAELSGQGYGLYRVGIGLYLQSREAISPREQLGEFGGAFGFH